MTKTRNLHTTGKGKRVVYPLLFVLLSGIIAFNIYRIIDHRSPYEVKPYKTDNGWGYRISAKEKIFIEQPFIPGLPGKKSFPTRRTARKTGELVLHRLQHQKLPAFTKEDLTQVGLDSVGNLRHAP
ncbi:MAG: DUF4907 domain-containing protein [Bacteroidales bacterium]|nr:DUF4907 domain-containing protein [Bacteroidales bacterium]